MGQDAGISMRFRVCVDPDWVRKNLMDCQARLVASPILMFLSRFRWSGDPTWCFSLILEFSSSSRMSRDRFEASCNSVRSDLYIWYASRGVSLNSIEVDAGSNRCWNPWVFGLLKCQS